MTVELSWQYSSQFVWSDVMADRKQMDMTTTHTVAASSQICHVTEAGRVVVTTQSVPRSVEQYRAAKHVCHSAGPAGQSARQMIHRKQSALVSAISSNTMTTHAGLARDTSAVLHSATNISSDLVP